MTSPDGDRTGTFFGLQYRATKLPSGSRMSYLCTAMVSGCLVCNTRSSEARRLPTPVADGSSGLSGKISKRPRLVGYLILRCINRSFPKYPSQRCVQVRLGKGFGDEVHAGIQSAMVDNRVAGISGRIEHFDPGPALLHLIGEFSPGHSVRQSD